jgi:hypothetical protein
LLVRPLAAGERVALDLASLEEWGDEPAVDPTTTDAADGAVIGEHM